MIHSILRTIDSIANLSLIISVFAVLSVKPAYAYLDPGTGSYFLQMALAGFLGGLFVLKSYWSQIKVFIQTRILRKNAAS